MTTQLAFHNIQFNVVNHNQQICFTAPQLATALAYADQSSVNRIYARHAEEFTTCMTASVKLTDPNGDAQDTRIFSLRGAHLIAMFARTPIAKEFRRWVLDVLDRQVGDPVDQPAPLAPTYPTEIHAFCDDHANRSEIIYYQDFKPIFCRTLSSREIVITPEAMKEWLEMRGLIFFTREELRKMTLEKINFLIEGR